MTFRAHINTLQVMKMIFKIKGNEFRTPSLNGWQRLNVAIYKLTGIRTNEYKHIERVNESLWRGHCHTMQNDLNEERMRGWGFCYLTGKRVDF